ncbi:MAG: sigma-E factor negative regulatory protein RseA [Betaproteobacteria bacterium]|jgi:sigma-E factor negative regulatory protein RseA|nr:sigma-E factor negative regulatory protein RseA [Betaproteobacteria bacterium]
MKDRISALMDGELAEREAAETIAALTSDAGARSAWSTYHLIGDALREGHSVRAPRRPAANAPFWRVALPATAVAAAVALVSWVAFGPVQQSQPAQVAPVAQAPATIPPPRAANDYLLAHQGFSPRVALQGMTAYVRTVSDPAEEPRR